MRDDAKCTRLHVLQDATTQDEGKGDCELLNQQGMVLMKEPIMNTIVSNKLT
jgi:hypothetical protein